MESFWRTVLKNLVRLSSNLSALKSELKDYRKNLVDHLEEKDELFEAEKLKRLNCLKSLLEDFNKFISTSTPSIVDTDRVRYLWTAPDRGIGCDINSFKRGSASVQAVIDSL